jgi:hypothetical protein
MKSIAPMLIGLAVVLTGCLNMSFVAPSGKYVSAEDFGVMYFQSDGTLHYVFASKTDFYDAKNLPPEKARWFLNTVGEVEVAELKEGEPEFRLEWHHRRDSFDLIRTQPNGTLPRKARYEKKG